MPTVFRNGPYRLFFYGSDRDEFPHVHVERDDDKAKLWLDPVRLQSSGGVTTRLKHAATLCSACMQPTERRVVVSGITLCVFEWNADVRRARRHGPSRPRHRLPRALLGSGGRPAAEAPRARRRPARARPERRPSSRRLAGFRADLVAVARAFAMRAAVGVGHSMGGHAMTEAAAAEPRCFRRLVLIDPVIGSPEAYAAGSRAAFADAPHPTARRRAHGGHPRRCSSVSAIARRSTPGTRRCCATTSPTDSCRPDGDGWVLACPPEFEADVYMAPPRQRRGV